LIESFYKFGQAGGSGLPFAGALHHLTYQSAPIVKGKRVTGFANEERRPRRGSVAPFLVEDELKRLRGLFERLPTWQPSAMVDGRLITGQNPASSTVAA
jgi:putative intracellular protease/amidase